MDRRTIILPLLILLTFLLTGLSTCRRGEPGAAESAPGARDRGTIVFTANGEDFVRQGFVDKDGWSIYFDKLYVNIASPTAYLPGDDEQVALEGAHWVDLAEGGPEAQPIVVGSAAEVPPANYQSLRFALRRASDGPYAGSSIVMIGTAAKDGVRVPFTIRLDEEMVFDGREGYVGGQLKGLLQPGASTEVEMTFHFDHVFGDLEAGEEDHISTGSVGFEFFKAFADGGVLDVWQVELKGADGYPALVRALWTLGHLGEGHCDVSEQSSRDLL